MSQHAAIDHAKRPRLWSVEGTGVLAREGDLVLLSGLDDSGLLDRLLDLLTEVAGAGGDGLEFTRAVEDVLNSDGTWRLGHQSPALIAFGPASAGADGGSTGASPGLAVTVTGAAWVQITTEHGTQRIVAGPSMLLRCLVGSPVHAVHGGLGSDQEGRGLTDRFSRLDAGIVRAGGLSYHTGYPAAPGTPEPGPEPAELESPEPGTSDLAAAAVPQPAAPEPAEPEPAEPVAAEPEPAEPEPAEPVAAEPQPQPAEPQPVAAEPQPQPAEPQPQPAGQQRVAAAPPGSETLLPGEGPARFDSVLLVGEEPLDEIDERPPLPLGAAASQVSAGLSAPVEILGVYCKNGHFDDPEARFCAVCGISMNQQTLVSRPGPRPPLGLLVLDGGAVFQLDADYVIGREPALDTTVAAGKARALRVADTSGTVSRVHAKIELDGWRVLVSDLGSANGTRVKQPGEAAAQQLTPRVPVRLLTGSYVDLGEAGFHYESHRGR